MDTNLPRLVLQTCSIILWRPIRLTIYWILIIVSPEIGISPRTNIHSIVHQPWYRKEVDNVRRGHLCDAAVVAVISGHISKWRVDGVEHPGANIQVSILGFVVEEACPNDQYQHNRSCQHSNQGSDGAILFHQWWHQLKICAWDLWQVLCKQAEEIALKLKVKSTKLHIWWPTIIFTTLYTNPHTNINRWVQIIWKYPKLRKYKIQKCFPFAFDTLA